MTDRQQWGVLLARFLGLALFLVGGAKLMAGVIETLPEFNPVYLWFYFLTVLARPLVWMFTGLVVLLLAKPLGRYLGRG